MMMMIVFFVMFHVWKVERVGLIRMVLGWVGVKFVLQYNNLYLFSINVGS